MLDPRKMPADKLARAIMLVGGTRGRGGLDASRIRGAMEIISVAYGGLQKRSSVASYRNLSGKIEPYVRAFSARDPARGQLSQSEIQQMIEEGVMALRPYGGAGCSGLALSLSPFELSPQRLARGVFYVAATRGHDDLRGRQLASGLWSFGHRGLSNREVSELLERYGTDGRIGLRGLERALEEGAVPYMDTIKMIYPS